MTVIVRNLREFIRATDHAGPATKKMVRDELKAAGEIVREDAFRRFRDRSPRTARGFRVAVRQRGVDVEQRLGKTTGLHPEWGAVQMKDALIPARDAKEPEIILRVEEGMENICANIRRS